MKHRRAQRERTDPKSDFFVPNSWENRRGEDPHALRSTGPPYEIDAESIAYADSVRVLSVGQKDPIQTTEIIVDYLSRPKFDRERHHCSTCQLWTDRGGWGLDAKERPPGTHDPDGCDGCVLSKLDSYGEDARARRDRLFGQWTDLRARYDTNEEAARLAQTRSEKKAVATRRKRLRESLEATERACILAGFNPAARQRREIGQSGETPALSPHHDRDRAFK